MELRTYTRIHAIFPTYCTEFAKELQQKAYTSPVWQWWSRDDDKIVNRTMLTRAWTIKAIETQEG
jgi:hypothetical protein